MREQSSPVASEPGRRERKLQQTIDHLSDTAWALFQAQGFEQVTMEAIAAAADVAKGTLYKHFPVKEALLRHRFHADLAKSMPAMLAQLRALPDATARLRAFFRHVAAWSIAHQTFLGHYVRFRLGEVNMPGNEATERRSGLDGLFTALIAEGQKAGEFNAALDPARQAYYLQFLHLATLLRWLNAPDLDLYTEFDHMFDQFLYGLGGAR